MPILAQSHTGTTPVTVYSTTNFMISHTLSNTVSIITDPRIKTERLTHQMSISKQCQFLDFFFSVSVKQFGTKFKLRFLYLYIWLLKNGIYMCWKYVLIDLVWPSRFSVICLSFCMYKEQHICLTWHMAFKWSEPFKKKISLFEKSDHWIFTI